MKPLCTIVTILLFQVIFNGGSGERLELALETGQNKLFISHGSVDVARIPSGSEDGKLKSFLNQCKLVHQQSVNRRGGKVSTLTRPKRSGKDKSKEEGQRSTSSSLESRETAKIMSRTYEGRKVKNGEARADQSSHVSGLSTNPQPHSSKRPLSDIFVTGASSFTDLSTTHSEHEEMVKKYQPRQIAKHSSADNLEEPSFCRQHSAEPLSGRGGRGVGFPLGSSWPRQSSGYDSDSNSVSTSSTLLRSHSQGSIPGVAGPSLGLSYGAMFKTRSLTRSIESVNTPTFDPPSRSSSAAFRRAPSYSRLDSGSSTAFGEELAAHVADIEERVGLLAVQFLHERYDMFKQIHAACELHDVLVD